MKDLLRGSLVAVYPDGSGASFAYVARPVLHYGSRILAEGLSLISSSLADTRKVRRKSK